MPYKAVLFDLDGTLLDTLKDIGDATNRVLAKEGLPTHPLVAYREFVGGGPRVLFERALPPERRDDALIASCMAAYSADYGQNWRVATRPFGGVGELLDGLLGLGVKLAVLSNKEDTFAKRCVSELLPNWRFNAILGLREGVPPKPDPKSALEIAHMLGLPPVHFVYLGDSATDMRTATAAGMLAVAALWGYCGEGDLRSSGAQALISRPNELMGFFAPVNGL